MWCRTGDAGPRPQPAALQGAQVVLAKPETFMNLSGVAVAALVEEFEADPARDLLVIYDELDLVLGTFKIRERGSPAGHNGARSVTGALGSARVVALAHRRGARFATRSDCSRRRKAAGQGLSALAHAQGGSGGAGRGAGPGGDGHAAHSRTGTGGRDERVQSEREDREQGSGNRESGLESRTANCELRTDELKLIVVSGSKALPQKRNTDVACV